MSSKSNIEWTDATWNPCLGCSKISPGCKKCYAIREVHRMASNPHPRVRAANEGLTVLEGGYLNWTGEVRLVPERLQIPLRTRKPTTYFVNSLSDWLHDSLDFPTISRIWLTMLACPWHRFQLLTKRAERLPDFVRWSYDGPDPQAYAERSAAHMWLGVSVESRGYLSRIDHLRRTPAAVRFLSLEPLLEDLGQLDLTGIHWVIVGGESGPGARPMHPDWVRSIRDQCVAAGVPCFFKQWGEWSPGHPLIDKFHPEYGKTQQQSVTFSGGSLLKNPCLKYERMTRVGKKAAGRFLDGRTWDEMPNVEVR